MAKLSNFISFLSGEEQQEAGVSKRYKRARNIVRELFQTTDRDQIIDRISKELNVSINTAQTYYYRAKNELFGGYVPAGEESSGKVAGSMSEEPPPKADKEEKGEDQDQQNPDDDFELEDEESQDPNRQGIIRTVEGAHLVYKRRNEEGTYDELWVYNIDNDIRTELEIKHAILAGTDIPESKTQSEDGKQFYTLTTLGNAQLLHIQGLPN